MKRLHILALVATLVLTATAGPASAAPRRVPRGFFGVVADPDLVLDNTPAVVDSQMAMMARNGVESLRTNFDWSATEPLQGFYVWQTLDMIVSSAARHGLQLLPIVEFTPRWASSHPSSAWTEYAPSDPRTYAAFMTQLVDRYGPNGSFWANNPSVPRLPIRSWQIWNEPQGALYDWRSSPWPSTYTALLKAAYTAVHAADRKAVVVSGAMVTLTSGGVIHTQWDGARLLYGAGAKRYFDVLAVNAFTNDPTSAANSVKRSIRIVQLVRQVMRGFGDRRKPIWVTEVTWNAGAGKIPPAFDQPHFETTARGQAKRLRLYFTKIAATRPYGIQRAFWYTWFSPYVPQSVNGDVPIFQYTGLTKWQPGAPVFQPMPILSTYAKLAAKFEGCRHSSSGSCV